MNTLNHIPAHPLPLNQDFKSLKESGIAFIQAYSGLEWTNFNASDPGVTILDQICFALTELGYCNDFPVNDILTDVNGDLKVEDQFYRPEDILTTSPVTINDYRKYIIDGVSGIGNVHIPLGSTTATGVNIYTIYLLVDGSITQPDEVIAVCNATFFYLNKRRNLGELFSVFPLIPAVHQIGGIIEIESVAALDNILAELSNAIRTFIFPEIKPSGYAQLKQNGVETNEIFNGPRLQNGWIPARGLGEKKDRINIADVTALLEAIPGVISVSGLSFDSSLFTITTDEHHVLIVDINASISNKLEFWCKGIKLAANAALDLNSTIQKVKKSDINIEFGAAASTQTKLPIGRYRDINNYYSIQNTFPEIFAVGANTINSNASDFQIAQSRQLKGYLTLFDQVLANQFAQLANIDRLFSFKNSTTGAPSDEEEFYAVKDQYERRHIEYPVPYQTFSPTYFYQALYDVPHIRPLLKNNEAFNFSYEIETGKELEQNSWKSYKLDPYNPYVRALMNFVEDEKTSLERRNNILDHLLARHGESPLMLDTIINGSIYSGDSLKDQVIFKSIYIQNLGLLSYFRQKAYCFTAATAISDELVPVPVDFEQENLAGNIHEAIFNSREVDAAERLTEPDFDNYAAIELKMSLLFGLTALYRNFIANSFDDKERDTDIRVALWMISKRKGMIMLETGLLLSCIRFKIVITSNGSCWQTRKSLDYIQAQQIFNTFIANKNHSLETQLRNGAFTNTDTIYQLEQVAQLENTNRYLKPISATGFYFTIKIDQGGEIDVLEDSVLFNNATVFVFPSFVLQTNNGDINGRLSLFLKNELPVQITGQCCFIDTPAMQLLITAFCAWHNSLIYKSKEPEATYVNNDPDILQNAGRLASLIVQFKLLPE